MLLDVERPLGLVAHEPDVMVRCYCQIVHATALKSMTACELDLAQQMLKEGQHLERHVEREGAGLGVDGLRVSVHLVLEELEDGVRHRRKKQRYLELHALAVVVVAVEHRDSRSSP